MNFLSRPIAKRRSAPKIGIKYGIQWNCIKFWKSFRSLILLLTHSVSHIHTNRFSGIYFRATSIVLSSFIYQWTLKAPTPMHAYTQKNVCWTTSIILPQESWLLKFIFCEIFSDATNIRFQMILFIFFVLLPPSALTSISCLIVHRNFFSSDCQTDNEKEPQKNKNILYISL